MANLQTTLSSAIFSHIQRSEKSPNAPVTERSICTYFEETIAQIGHSTHLNGTDIRTRLTIAISALPNKKVTAESMPKLVRAMATDLRMPATQLATALSGGAENVDCSLSWLNEDWYASPPVQGVVSDALYTFSAAHKECASISGMKYHVEKMISMAKLPLVPSGTWETLLDQISPQDAARDKLSRAEFVKILVFMSTFGTSRKNVSERKKLVERLKAPQTYFAIVKQKSTVSSTTSSKMTSLTSLTNHSVQSDSSDRLPLRSLLSSPVPPPRSGISTTSLINRRRALASARVGAGASATVTNTSEASSRSASVIATDDSHAPLGSTASAGNTASASKPPTMSAFDSMSALAGPSYESGGASFATAHTKKSSASSSVSTAFSGPWPLPSPRHLDHSRAPPLSTPLTTKATPEDLLPTRKSMTMESKELVLDSPDSSLPSIDSLKQEVKEKREILMHLTSVNRIRSEVRTIPTRMVDVLKVFVLGGLLVLIVFVGLDIFGKLDELPLSRSYTTI